MGHPLHAPSTQSMTCEKALLVSTGPCPFVKVPPRPVTRKSMVHTHYSHNTQRQVDQPGQVIHQTVSPARTQANSNIRVRQDGHL